jgi:NADH dehydrogenase
MIAAFSLTRKRPRIVVVGAGFGGLSCVKALASADADVLLLDWQNHHCFQPLLYQVATAALAPNDVAWPIRSIVRGQKNTTTLLAEVTGVDLVRGQVLTDKAAFGFDHLVLATGARHSYFGHESWAAFAPGLKRVEDATAIRRDILIAFEKAELANDEAERRAALTFIVVGGGPTGVELAGAISELARHALPHEFRRIDPRRTRIILLEAGKRLLSTYSEDLSAYALRALAKKGVETRLGCAVTACDADGVDTEAGRIDAGTVVWAAGVKASPAATWVNAPHDRAGRALVRPDLSIEGHPNVFVIGDAAAAMDGAGKPVPAIAPAAKQMGRYVGRLIARRLAGRPAPAPFRYRHAGDLATIGCNQALARFGRVRLTGFIGWTFWSLAHIYYLVGARNRIAVTFNWLWDYITYQRGVRLILFSDARAAAQAAAAEPEKKREREASQA